MGLKMGNGAWGCVVLSKGGILADVMNYSTMGLRERLLVSKIQIEICLQVP